MKSGYFTGESGDTKELTRVLEKSYINDGHMRINKMS